MGNANIRLIVTMVDDSGESIGVELDPAVATRIIQEEVWAQTAWPVGEPTLAELISRPTPQIYRYSSDEDGYLAGVVLAYSEEEARSVAFEDLKESRPEEWAEYHPDPSGILVQCLGRHGGAGDGNGNVEFE